MKTGTRLIPTRSSISSGLNRGPSHSHMCQQVLRLWRLPAVAQSGSTACSAYYEWVARPDLDENPHGCQAPLRTPLAVPDGHNIVGYSAGVPVLHFHRTGTGFASSERADHRAASSPKPRRPSRIAASSCFREASAADTMTAATVITQGRKPLPAWQSPCDFETSLLDENGTIFRAAGWPKQACS